jgi:hypothetical protein
MENIITITIKNWEKYNVRCKDYERPWWFSLSNEITTDDDMCELTDAEFRAWIHVLAMASKGKSGTVAINTTHLRRKAMVQPEALKTMIQKLSVKSILSVSGQELAELRPDGGLYITEQDSTEQDKTVHNKTLSSASKRSAGPRSGNLWNSYRDAFVTRYQVEPVRNARVNKNLCTLIDRVGEEAAKELVKFYLTHNDSYYLKRQHDISLCLQHAESLHTQMQRGQPITGSDIRAFEKQDYYEKQIDRLQMEDL